MSTDYDSADASFANKQEMENTQYATSGKPSINIIHPIECAHGLNNINSYFVNTTAVPSGKDIRFYDLGTFQIATQGLSASAGQVLGELWVSYEVCLYKPILSPSSTANAHFELPTTVSASHYLGPDTTTNTLAVSSTATFGYVSNSTFTFNNGAPLGWYTLMYTCHGVSTTLTTKLAITRGDTTSIGVGSFFNNDAASFQAEVAGAVGDVAWFYLCVQLKQAINTSGNASYITISAGTLPASVSDCQFVVNYWGSQAPF
jgi:putative flippase GtrA